MMKKGTNICIRCNTTWYGPLTGSIYCEECKKIVNAEKQKAFRQKQKQAQQEKEAPKIIRIGEIVKLAEAEGLSYGKYCLKYGL